MIDAVCLRPYDPFPTQILSPGRHKHSCMRWNALEVKWQFNSQGAKQKIPFGRRSLVSDTEIAEITPIVDILVLLVQIVDSYNI